MIDLYIAEPGTLFPKKFINTFTHRQLLVHPVHRFTEDQIGALMAGESVRVGPNDYFGELTPKFLDELIVSELIDEHGRLTSAEIAEIEGESDDNIKQILCRARAKMRSDTKMATMLQELLADETKITVRTIYEFV